VLCTGAAIGTADSWHERAAAVRSVGIEAMLSGAVQRWFSPGFTERRPDVSSALLHALRDTDPESYAQTCEALSGFDVTARLSGILTPVLAIAGRDDIPTPPDSLRRIASGVKDGRLVVLDGVGHLAPAEAPAEVARLITEHVAARPATIWSPVSSWHRSTAVIAAMPVAIVRHASAPSSSAMRSSSICTVGFCSRE